VNTSTSVRRPSATEARVLVADSLSEVGLRILREGGLQAEARTGLSEDELCGIVGGYDGPVIEMNREALAQLTCPKELIIVPGATHLFEEPGTLEQVADHAGDWFERHLTNTEIHARHT